MSIIKSIKQVLGLGPAAENHHWDGSVPNQLSLKRGTPEAPGSTVMLVVDGVLEPVQTGPAFSAKRTTIQTVTSTTDAVVVFPTELFDTANSYNPSNGRFQPSVAGYYQINAGFIANSDNTLTSASLAILKNGAENVGSSIQVVTGTIGSRTVSALVYMNGTTDYLEVVATLAGTGPLYVDAASTKPAIFSAFLARKA